MKYLHGPSLSSALREGNLTQAQTLILNRLFKESEKPKDFFNYDFQLLHSPFLLPDMKQAILKLKKAIYENKKILIYGDRDTDGVSSASILTLFLRDKISNPQNLQVRTSSENDDYGLSASVMQKIFQIKPDLLITLDFGTSNYDEINTLHANNIQTIVLDHHEIPIRHPNCLLVNPKREDSSYPEKKICSSVIAYKFILGYLVIEYFESKYNDTLFPWFDEKLFQELDYQNIISENPNILEATKHYLALSAVGTITDLMPLLGENRIIVWNGCKVIQEIFKNPEKNLGLHTLIKNLNLNPNKITSKDLGWGIGPVLNAAGRMGRSETAIQLLLARNEEEAKKYCNEILLLNQERKERTKRNVFRAEQYFARQKEREETEIIFCHEPDMESGVSGIVATKLVEVYRKPVVFITYENGKARGSIRSYGNENVVELMQKVSDLLIHYGGHPEAGGFSMEIKNIPILEQRLKEIGKDWVSNQSTKEPTTSVFQITPEELQENLYEEISIFEPFGHANPFPLISISNAEIFQFRYVGNGTHAKFSILKASSNIKCLLWNRANELSAILSQKNKIDLWGHLEENYFKGVTSINFQVIHFE